MEIKIPELSLVFLINISGLDISKFALRHFESTEILSIDSLVSNISDQPDQLNDRDILDILNVVLAKRLSKGKFTVIDSYKLSTELRKSLILLTKEYHFIPVAIVFDLQKSQISLLSNEEQQLDALVNVLKDEGFSHIFTLPVIPELDNISVTRIPLRNNLKHDHGPFDIVGDIHGCFDELCELLSVLGYEINKVQNAFKVNHPENRKVIFLGDLVDRGPNTPDVMRIVISMVKDGKALCVPGNHDAKLVRKFKDKDIKVGFGLAESLAQLEQEDDSFVTSVVAFLDSLVSHYLLDDGKLVVAHAGMKEEYQGRGSSIVKEFAMYGESTGEIDDYGLLVRYDWAKDYKGKAMVVYGHTPVAEAEWVNNTINIDTGCVFGGKLTALRYPEKQLVSIKAKKTYYSPMKPFLANDKLSPAYHPRSYHDLLDINDVLGKRLIQTAYLPSISIPDNSAPISLEIFSNYAVPLSALVYLPPDNLYSEMSSINGYIEHPFEAFNYYHNMGISNLICVEKRLGDRIIIIICKDKETASKRFGISDSIGICYNSIGLSVFEKDSLEFELLKHLSETIDRTGIWAEFGTSWLILDCEIIKRPVNNKFSIDNNFYTELLSNKMILEEAIDLLYKAESRGVDTNSRIDTLKKRYECYEDFLNSFIPCDKSMQALEDFNIVPIHLLATEGKAHIDKNHLWHINVGERLCENDYLINNKSSILLKMPYVLVDISDQKNRDFSIQWWEELCSQGHEGIIIKPYDFFIKRKANLIKPAIICRGREYLRGVYGPEYTLEEQKSFIKDKNNSFKEKTTIQEFALGLEALQRYVRGESLYRIHECIFAILSLKISAIQEI